MDTLESRQNAFESKLTAGFSEISATMEVQKLEQKVQLNQISEALAMLLKRDNNVTAGIIIAVCLL